MAALSVGVASIAGGAMAAFYFKGYRSLKIWREAFAHHRGRGNGGRGVLAMVEARKRVASKIS